MIVKIEMQKASFFFTHVSVTTQLLECSTQRGFQKDDKGLMKQLYDGPLVGTLTLNSSDVHLCTISVDNAVCQPERHVLFN